MLENIVFWHWLVFGFVLLALEMLVPGTVFLWFGAGALLVGGLTYLLPWISWEWQVLLFALVSLSSLFVWKKMRKGSPEDDTESGTLSQRGRGLIGRQAPLVEAIKNGVGRVQIDDTFWRVEGEDMELGSLIEVVEADGATLEVKKA